MRDDFEISEKHIPLRIVGFILAFALAVGAFTFALLRIGHREEGWYAIDAHPNDDVPLYAVGVELQYYFRGGSSEIRRAAAALSDPYSAALLDARKLLDPERTYPDMQNLCSLNSRPGEAVTLSPELNAILRDAWEKTLEGEGYSLFAGPLYAEWNSILNLTEPEEFDPLRSEEERARLAAIAAACADPAAHTLEFLPDNAVRLTVSEDYVRFLGEYELEPVYLDLNLLEESYLLRLVADRLEREGYSAGALTTASGLSLILSGRDAGLFRLYGEIDGRPAPAARFPADPGSAASLLRAFPFTAEEIGYYTIDGKLRHPAVPADGSYRDRLLSSLVVSGSGDLTAACYENLRLNAAEDPLRLAAESGLDLLALIPQGEDPTRVHVFGAAADRLEPETDYGFETVKGEAS